MVEKKVKRFMAQNYGKIFVPAKLFIKKYCQNSLNCNK